MVAGILAQTFGNEEAFSLLSVLGAASALILLKITPRKINVKRIEKAVIS